MSETPAPYSVGKSTTVAEMLEEVFEARCFLDALNLKRKDALDALITPEIRSRMLSIEAEFEEPITEQTERIAEMEKAVKARVETEGCSTKSEHLHAIWMKGRVSWDNKKLDAYSVADPKLLAFRTEGSPSVSLRPVTK